MTALVAQGLKGVFDALADAIEGGNAYRGSGTAFKGIPGRYAFDKDLPLTVTATGGSTTTVEDSASAFPTGRWAPQKGPPYFLLGLTGANADAHRKVTAWTNSGATKRFTVAAFASAVTLGETFELLQGFKRLPNGADIEDGDVGSPDGYDRYFHLSALTGMRTPWSGSGAWTFSTSLKLRVRFLKFGRLHDWTTAALTNMAILRAGLARTEHYDGTYIRALTPSGEAVVLKDDATKLVVEDSFGLYYRLDTSFS